MTLVDDLRRHAAAAPDRLEGLHSGQDRYGPVAAVLFASGSSVSVRERAASAAVSATAW
ncbi:hypothetical protein ACI2K4_28580 [Micromonospora sp. NPDC050397]|uniref:hypothetical protein n=1 Tax=Micromonospora sp. NPDC050397 TaxID=3364279 RepID=UPI00384C0C49